MSMADDDDLVPIPARLLRALLDDHDRLESLAMLAASHAGSRLADIRQLCGLLRERGNPDPPGARLPGLARRIEVGAESDMLVIQSALRRRARDV